MTFKDFGLNPMCNVYEKAATTKNGVEYAIETIPSDSVVFVVDLIGNTVCIVNDKNSKNVYVSKKYCTGCYFDSNTKEVKKTKDYTIIGSWMMDCVNEYKVFKYGVIVENTDGSFQVLDQ